MKPMLAHRRKAVELADALDGRAVPRSAEVRELVAAVDVLRALPVVQPRPDFTAELRARLVATAQREFLPRQRGEQPPAVRVLTPRRRAGLAAASSVFVLVGGGAGLASASASALPGDLLYPVKRGVERIDMALAGDAGDEGRTALDQARTRLTEVQALLQTDDPGAAAGMTDALEDFTAAASYGGGRLTTSYAETGDEAEIAAVRDFTVESGAILDEMSGTLPPETEAAFADASATVNTLDDEATRLCPTCGDGAVALTVPTELVGHSVTTVPTRGDDVVGVLRIGTDYVAGTSATSATSGTSGTSGTASPERPAAEGPSHVQPPQSEPTQPGGAGYRGEGGDAGDERAPTTTAPPTTTPTAPTTPGEEPARPERQPGVRPVEPTDQPTASPDDVRNPGTIDDPGTVDDPGTIDGAAEEEPTGGGGGPSVDAGDDLAPGEITDDAVEEVGDLVRQAGEAKHAEEAEDPVREIENVVEDVRSGSRDRLTRTRNDGGGIGTFGAEVDKVTAGSATTDSGGTADTGDPADQTAVARDAVEEATRIKDVKDTVDEARVDPPGEEPTRPLADDGHTGRVLEQVDEVAAGSAPTDAGDTADTGGAVDTGDAADHNGVAGDTVKQVRKVEDARVTDAREARDDVQVDPPGEPTRPLADGGDTGRAVEQVDEGAEGSAPTGSGGTADTGDAADQTEAADRTGGEVRRVEDVKDEVENTADNARVDSTHKPTRPAADVPEHQDERDAGSSPTVPEDVADPDETADSGDDAVEPGDDATEDVGDADDPVNDDPVNDDPDNDDPVNEEQVDEPDDGNGAPEVDDPIS